MTVSKHCCEAMTNAVSATCAEHENRFECPDALVSYSAKFDEYGLIIHDGGRSVQSIAFCPWCGGALPESKRSLWFDSLEALGIESPLTDPIPDEFRSDLWWRRRARTAGESDS